MMIDDKLESSIADQIRKNLSIPMIGILQKIHFLEAGVLLIFANDGIVASSYLLGLIFDFPPSGQMFMPNLLRSDTTDRSVQT